MRVCWDVKGQQQRRFGSRLTQSSEFFYGEYLRQNVVAYWYEQGNDKWKEKTGIEERLSEVKVSLYGYAAVRAT